MAAQPDIIKRLKEMELQHVGRGGDKARNIPPMCMPSDEPCNCPICLEPVTHAAPSGYSEDESGCFLDDVQLRCGHRFHYGCLSEQTEHGVRPDTCPICRQSCLDKDGILQAWRRHFRLGMHYDNMTSDFEDDQTYREMPDVARNEMDLVTFCGDPDGIDNVRILLQEGVSANACIDRNGPTECTALDMACLGGAGKIDLVKLLLEHGALPTDETREGAKQGGNVEIMRLVGDQELVCASCGKVSEGAGKLMRCAACKTSHYCDRDCQKLHWKKHKRACKWRKTRSELKSMGTGERNSTADL